MEVLVLNIFLLCSNFLPCFFRSMEIQTLEVQNIALPFDFPCYVTWGKLLKLHVLTLYDGVIQ